MDSAHNGCDGISLAAGGARRDKAPTGGPRMKLYGSSNLKAVAMAESFTTVGREQP
jgi:hypothetical protein